MPRLRGFKHSTKGKIMDAFFTWLMTFIGKAFDIIISEGVLGALFIVSLVVIGILAWMLYRARKLFTDYLINDRRAMTGSGVWAV